MAPMGYVSDHSTTSDSRRDGRGFERLLADGRSPGPAKAADFGTFLVMVSAAFVDRNNAAVGDFALNVLELDGRVDHAEVVMQNLFHVP